MSSQMFVVHIYHDITIVDHPVETYRLGLITANLQREADTWKYLVV